MFEFLFKHPRPMFQDGHLELSASWLTYAVVVVILLVVVSTALGYWRARGGAGRLDRAMLSVLRTALLAILVFSLFKPVLVTSTVVPQRNVVGVLIDDSRSMRIADARLSGGDDVARYEAVRTGFDPEKGEIATALAQNFTTRFFRFSSVTESLDHEGTPSFAGGQTDLAGALDAVRKELAGLPIAGLVVVTDGADNAHGAIDKALLALQADAIPVYTVGVGQERYARDIELARVRIPDSALSGAALTAEVTVRQRGFGGQTVSLVVEDDDGIVTTQSIAFGENADTTTTRIRLDVRDAGPRRFSFNVPVQENEVLGENNARHALVTVHDRAERILYFEGEPRFELKFLRRAVADDKNIRLTSLLRTAENKYYRIGIDDAEELRNGFPSRREELFAYRGLILGSVEASYFSPAQLQLIADFVGERGGSLLVLGGRRALAEGGFAGTPLEAILPVVLSGKSQGDFAQKITVVPTAAGAVHPLTQIADTESGSVERWQTLPAVTVVNPIRAVKPGATALLQSHTRSDPLVALAVQPYGRGQVMAFPVQDSWQWQMHPDVEPEDQTHETFWQQMLRWLVRAVPEHLEVSVSAYPVAPGAPVNIASRLSDERYAPISDAEVCAVVISPTGEEIDVPLARDVARAGEYAASFVPDAPGLYELRVEARDGEKTLSESTAYLQVEHTAYEYYDSEMNTPLLTRMAEQTGGRFYPAADASTLPDDIVQARKGVTVVQRHALWDMPALLLLFLALLCLEWGYRRWRRLA